MRILKWYSVSCIVILFCSLHSPYAYGTTIEGDVTSSTFTFSGPVTISTLTISSLLTSVGTPIQIVYGSTTTATTTTSDTYADTGLSASIKPHSASNKVLVIVTQSVDASLTGSNSVAVMGLQIVRGGTAILTNERAFGPNFLANLGLNGWPSTVSMVYLDSPATTNSTTYKTQFMRVSGSDGTVKVQNFSTPSTIILLEISS